LILNPGANDISIALEKGSGRMIIRNLDLRNGASELLILPPGGSPPNAGEITSFEIAPATVDGGWIMCQSPAKAILKGRNLKAVEVFWFPTGTGIEKPVAAGAMKKVRASAQQDTWELPLSDVMSTSFWAQATDVNGGVIKSIDLGNVGFALDSSPKGQIQIRKLREFRVSYEECQRINDLLGKPSIEMQLQRYLP
jgi:hypothetical protein